MNRWLGLTAIIEAATGLALMIDPLAVTQWLLGAPVSGAAVALGRVGGFGLLSLGLACWFGRNGAGEFAPAFRAMLTYNVLVTLYLLSRCPRRMGRAPLVAGGSVAHRRHGLPRPRVVRDPEEALAVIALGPTRFAGRSALDRRLSSHRLGRHARMRFSDAFLNAFVILVCLLFVTGGVVPPAGAPRVLTEINQLGPWVAVLIGLILWRRLRDGSGAFTGTQITRQLGALADRACERPGPLYLFIAIWTCLLVAVSIRRHLAFDDNGDLAIFDQAFWNTLHAAFVRSSLIPGATGEVSIFADHFGALQLGLLPLYAVLPSPLLLLTAQSVMLALGALPLYWLARALPDHRVLSTIFPVLYLLYLPLRGANRYDYHPSALAPPLLLLALYFMEKARWGRMLLFLGMAGLLKENIPIAGVTIGLYLLLAKHRRVLGLVVAAVFGLWFYAGFAWIIPAFNPGGTYPHFLDYPVFAGSPSGIFLAPVRHPVALFTALFTAPGQKLGYLLYVFGPVAFLPFLSPARLCLGLPFLAQNLLSIAPHQTSLQTHHAAELIPFVFFAAIGGASNLLRRLDHTRALSPQWEAAGLRRALAGLLLVISLLFHGLPETFYLRLYARTPHHDRLDAALRLIPAEASVSTWTKILPHVSHRRALYRFPTLGFSGTPEAEFVLIDNTLLPRSDVAAVTAFLTSLPAKGYENVLDQEGISLFRKRPCIR